MAGLAAHELGVGIGHSTNPKAGLKPLEANYSPYMKALFAAHQGEIVNFCPFGCEDDALDEHGRCYHRIGCSPDGKRIEREVRRKDGMLAVQVPRERKNGKMRPVLEKVDRSLHTLVQVSTSFLVYEDRECPPGWLPDGGLNENDADLEAEGDEADEGDE